MPAPTSTRRARHRALLAAAMATAVLGSLLIAAPASASGTSSSRQTAVAAVKTPVATSRPKMSGTLKAGYVLTANPGAWNVKGLTPKYEWFRNGKQVAGAAGKTYALTTADVGARIKIRVFVTKTGYARAGAWSAETKAVAAPSVSFKASGTLRVGTDIKPGTYVTGKTTSCYWERKTDASGSFESIIANDLGGGQRLMTVLPTDKYVTLSDCGAWYRSFVLGSPGTKIAGEGISVVSSQIVPGTYKSTASEYCYWERLSNGTGDFSAVIQNDYVEAGSTYVTISRKDFAFSSSGCGTWKRVGA